MKIIPKALIALKGKRSLDAVPNRDFIEIFHRTAFTIGISLSLFTFNRIERIFDTALSQVLYE